MTPVEIDQSVGTSLIAGVSSWQDYQTVRIRNFTTFIILAVQMKFINYWCGSLLHDNIVSCHRPIVLRFPNLVDELNMLENDGILL